MPPKTLEQLKEENEKLRRVKIGRDSLQRLSEKRNLERKKLIAENKALRNPGSIRAKKTFLAISGKFGRIIKKGTLAVHNNLERIAAEEERQERALRKRKKVKRKSPQIKPIRRATTRRRVRR